MLYMRIFLMPYGVMMAEKSHNLPSEAVEIARLNLLCALQNSWLHFWTQPLFQNAPTALETPFQIPREALLNPIS